VADVIAAFSVEVEGSGVVKFDAADGSRWSAVWSDIEDGRRWPIRWRASSGEGYVDIDNSKGASAMQGFVGSETFGDPKL
jgi:hypothetical protein